MVENKCCGHLMKNNFIKDLVILKEVKENFESFRKCWICDVEKETNVNSLENIGVLQTKILISTSILNYKIPAVFSESRKLWCMPYYSKTGKMWF